MATDIYLAESIIHFSGQLSAGIGLAIPLHGEKKSTPQYNENSVRSIYHLKDTVKQQDVFIRLNSLDVIRHSIEKPHNACTTQLVSFKIFESC